MPAATSDAPSLDELEAQLESLMKVKVFNDTVREGANSILSSMPSPDKETNPSKKARLLLLRCKAQLLLPYASKEAEKDLNTALKLQQGSTEMWVELGECFLRRNAFREACDALDNALRLDPRCTAALCKYSQVQRNRCGEAGATPEQKTEYLQDSVAKAHEAVQIDMNSAECWHTLSLSLLSTATAEGMSYAGARKALAAMQQADRKGTGDPDVYYNKAVLESLVGEFGASVTDFIRAHELDHTRLKGTTRQCEENAAVLQRTITRLRNAAGVGRRDMKKTQSNLSTAVAKGGKTAAALTHVGVLDIASDARMQPQVILTVDGSGAPAFVLLYGVSGSSFKIGDVLSFPTSRAQRVEVTHTTPDAPALGVEALSLTILHYYVEAGSILVNDRPLSAQSRVPLQMSSRLFA